MIDWNLRQRADRCIAQGALTNSKRPSVFVDGVYPTHAHRGDGAFLYVGKARFLDYVCGLGTNLLGYGNLEIAGAIYKRYLNGSTLSLSSELEIDVAERLKELLPFTDLWKFTKTGTEASSVALRIARAKTGRDLVLSDAYHGWSDDFVSLTPPALGVPKREFVKPLDMDLLPQAAAVIVEPVILDYSESRKDYLKDLRDKCTKHGVVLIFDEIITGFRFPKYAVSRYFGIDPDIILLGKAMGGGMPLSAVGGKKDVMNCGEYFTSGTFFGETVSLEACKTFLNLLTKDASKFQISSLWEMGHEFLKEFNSLCEVLKIVGYPSRGAFQGDDLVKTLFWQEAIKAGILFGPSWFYNFKLIEHNHYVLSMCKNIFMRIKSNSVKLEGKMPQKPFAQRVRENA